MMERKEQYKCQTPSYTVFSKFLTLKVTCGMFLRMKFLNKTRLQKHYGLAHDALISKAWKTVIYMC